MLMTYDSTAGLTTVGYAIINDDKTTDTALTTTGVTEMQSGSYGVNLADSKAGKTIQWYEGATYQVSDRIPYLSDASAIATVVAATDTLEASATSLAAAVDTVEPNVTQVRDILEADVEVDKQAKTITWKHKDTAATLLTKTYDDEGTTQGVS